MEIDDGIDDYDDNFMVLMMLTVCWNLMDHCQGRTKLTVLVKGVLR